MADNENDSNDQSQQETESVRRPEPTPPEGRVILEDTTPPIKDPIVNKQEG